MSSSPSSLPKQPTNGRPSPHLSARSLSLSNKTGTHLARPCGLNWIRYTRLFRHCVLAWESPSRPSENSRQEGHLQHLSADLRVGVSQGRRGSLAKEGSPVSHCAPAWCQVQSGTCPGLLLHLILWWGKCLYLTKSVDLLQNFLEFIFHLLTGKYICQQTTRDDKV